MSKNLKDPGAGCAAQSELVAKFLHPRMMAEHIYSGGGLCMHSSIRSMIPGLRFAGRALTVRTLAGFTRRTIEALSRAGKGDVLVIAAGGVAEVSPWGGVVHWNAARKGLAGVVIDEAKLSHLAYAPEIASVMLRRQQAEAVLAARQKIVQGAVEMVDQALKHLAEKNVVELDTERKAAMVTNLLVVLCSDNDAQPVVNAGTMYQ